MRSSSLRGLSGYPQPSGDRLVEGVGLIIETQWHTGIYVSECRAFYKAVFYTAWKPRRRKLSMTAVCRKKPKE